MHEGCPLKRDFLFWLEKSGQEGICCLVGKVWPIGINSTIFYCISISPFFLLFTGILIDFFKIHSVFTNQNDKLGQTVTTKQRISCWLDFSHQSSKSLKRGQPSYIGHCLVVTLFYRAKNTYILALWNRMGKPADSLVSLHAWLVFSGACC